MLELRVVVGAKQLACMREAIARECRLARADDDDHVERVCALASELIAREPIAQTRSFPRREHVLVLVTAQSDATMLLVRDGRTARDELGDRRHTALEASATRWSTMSGIDGRTIWAEIPRAIFPHVACAP
jgi:hypothetical protein